MVLTGVIAFHELGHFLAARVQGIRIENYSIGFGPEILSITPKDQNGEPGVKYSLRAIPLGGYVSFPRRIEEGEEPEENPDGDVKIYDPEDPDLLENRPPLDRIFVISAGVIANLLLSFSLVFASVSTVGVTKPTFGEGVVIQRIVDQGGPAVSAGLQVNDKILKIEDLKLPVAEDAVGKAVKSIRSSEGASLRLVVDRNGQQIEKTITPKANGAGSNYGIGVMLANNVERTDYVRLSNPAEAAGYAAKDVAEGCKYIFGNFVKLVTGAGSAGDISGPLGVIEAGAEMAETDGLLALLSFASLVSINLAVVNALPIPALDGGQLLFVLAEVAQGRKLNKDLVENVNILFFFLLVGFSSFALVGDVEKLATSALKK